MTIRQSGYAPSGGTDNRSTISTTVVAASAVLALTTETAVFLDVQAQPVMVTFDGSDPTSSNGHLLAAGYSAYWSKQQWMNARFIRQGASDGTIHVSPMVD